MNYRNLEVWKRSLDLTADIYRLTKQLPKEELFGLSDQMRRAVVSIPSNIAEGAGRNSDKEFKRFLFIANGSIAELETQLLICEKLDFADQADIYSLLRRTEEIRKMIFGLKNRIDLKSDNGDLTTEI